MKISRNFQNFIFGVVLPDLLREKICFRDEETNLSLPIYMLPKESARDLLKHFDLNYPRDEKGRPVSYTQLDTKQMHDHVEWIERTAALSGIQMRHVTQEFERMCASCHIS